MGICYTKSVFSDILYTPLLEHDFREVEAASSSLVTPIGKIPDNHCDSGYQVF